MNPLETLLESNPYVLADGGMGTMLMTAGLDHGQPAESWNQLHPDRVRAIHRAFIGVGSQVILTNSFGGHPARLTHHGLREHAQELNRLAALLARSEADMAPHQTVVAGSMGPTGEFLEPFGSLMFDQARDGFAEQAAALIEGSVDVLWIETMSDLQEIRAAVEGARSAGDRPVIVTLSYDTNGRTMMGVAPDQAVAVLQELQPVALGANCGTGPEEVAAAIQSMHAADSNVVLIAKANAGLPESIDGRFIYGATPEIMANYAVNVYRLGARIIGACCGSTPEHLRAMAKALRTQIS